MAPNQGLQKPHTLRVDQQQGHEGEITLRWHDERNFWDKLWRNPAPVLGLGCFYELDFGGRSLIDRLQFRANNGPSDRMTRQGCLTMVPYIWHKGTELADNGQCEESILVNTDKLDKLKRITVYAFVLRGKPRWKRINPTLYIKMPGCEPIEIPFTATTGWRKKLYTIAEITIGKNSEITVSEIQALHKGHGEANKACDWQLNVK